MGYAIYDINRACDEPLLAKLRAIPQTIRVRVPGVVEVRGSASLPAQPLELNLSDFTYNHGFAGKASILRAAVSAEIFPGTDRR